MPSKYLSSESRDDKLLNEKDTIKWWNAQETQGKDLQW